MNVPVEVCLKSKKGKALKHFSVLGPQNIDRILLWIWRDLFLSLLANGSEVDKQKVPNFLEDIETSLGIGALERVLYGGRPSMFHLLSTFSKSHVLQAKLTMMTTTTTKTLKMTKILIILSTNSSIWTTSTQTAIATCPIAARVTSMRLIGPKR